MFELIHSHLVIKGHRLFVIFYFLSSILHKYDYSK